MASDGWDKIEFYDNPENYKLWRDISRLHQEFCGDDVDKDKRFKIITDDALGRLEKEGGHMNIFAVLAPTAMVSAGAVLKAKDTNDTGADDDIGNLLILEAPVVEAAIQGNSVDKKKMKKIMTSVRDGAQAWLDANP